MELNKQQIDAIEHTQNKHALVIAGPGSGKTTIILNRLKFLFEKQNISPKNVLVLSFTNRAVEEIFNRLLKQKILSQEGWDQIEESGTIHSLAHSVLRKYDEIFYKLWTRSTKTSPANFKWKIVDEKEVIEFLYKRNIFEHDEKNLKINSTNCQVTVSRFLSYVSKTKRKTYVNSNFTLTNEWIFLDEKEMKEMFFAFESDKWAEENLPITIMHWKELFIEWQIFLNSSCLMDFDDTLIYSHRLLKENPDILEEYRKKFKHVLVDEFQDLNQIQFEIIKEICCDNNNSFCVGDPNQSIYSFQGAVPDIFNDFQMIMKKENIQTFHLQNNYRCSGNIVNFSNSIISFNREKFHEKFPLLTTNEYGEAIKFIVCKNLDEKLIEIIERISFFVEKKNIAHKEIAILYRNNSENWKLKEMLRQAQFKFIDYQLAKEIKSKHSRFIIIIMNFLFFPKELTAKIIVEELIYKKILGKEEIDNLYQKYHNFLDIFIKSKEHRIFESYPIMKLFSDMLAKEKLSEIFDKYKMVNIESISNIYSFFNLIFKFLKVYKCFDNEIYSLEEWHLSIIEIKDFWYLEYFSRNKAVKPVTYGEFFDILYHYTLHNYRYLNSDYINLSTIHSSKGGEYEVVFILNCTEKFMPSEKAYNEFKIREERRVFYVAASRAKKYLLLFSQKDQTPSRFFLEVQKKNEISNNIQIICEEIK